ncbi:hypothetical protein C7974DRAFT_469017 [Boeremia exigua]|uniref:uncharacterized protein n=1 Tax=Boeremia exigua TaxID=749465 RepID=UPI001E8D67B2|nr:uncharacterized protein C7974DRAFT_469017 [Boeremia exigua]KAH6642718.1 hypothetical protein C7974DRAFT_469017 [Boeremia exigua]
MFTENAMREDAVKMKRGCALCLLGLQQNLIHNHYPHSCAGHKMEGQAPGEFGRLYDVYKELGTREPSTLEQARAVIEYIRAEKGYLDEDALRELDTISPRIREQVLRIVQLKQEYEAGYTTSISEQLYTSKYRFLYELVQNADDSSYRTAAQRGVAPYLRLDITPDMIIVETNEDGFTRANVEAICATGKSSKKASQHDDHIGEKGFGFKAVFSIAEEVHIQSGLWSFGFKHCKGQRGLGMVTPLDFPPEVLSGDTTTRITLRYSSQAKSQYPTLIKAVKDLPDAMIMFLQRLQTLYIAVTTNGQCKKSSTSREYDSSKSRCTITQGNGRSYAKDVKTWTYLLFSQTERNLPADERRKDRTEAKIELAFPIDPLTKKPKVSDMGQHVFAYLPLQRLSRIQFIIQADFITAANRENVADCPWNDAIYEGVAKLFVSAVTGTFAQPDQPMQYSWLDYLPMQPMDHPWKQLTSTIQKSITNSLSIQPVIQSRERRQFKEPHHFRHLVDAAMHNDEPLLPDLADEIYMADGYNTRHRTCLTALGVTNMSWSDIFRLLRADIVRPSSRLKSKPSTDPWHETLSDLLVKLSANRSLSHLQKHIKPLALLPLSDSRSWTGAPGVSVGGPRNIYFAYVGETPIPKSLPLSVLDTVASINPKRRAFAEAMGVEDCPKAIVFAEIRKRHCETLFPIIENDQFTFLYHQQCNVSDIKDWVKVPLTAGGSARAKDTNLYFASDGEFDMFMLLPKQNETAKFMASSLLNAQPPSISVNNEDWKTWLARATGARSFPPLLDRETMNLSPEVRDVAKHNPRQFLGMLKAHWNEYQEDSCVVEEELRNCKVHCRSGNLVGLHTTYLPTKVVIETINNLGIPESIMPLLSVSDSTLDDLAYRSWRFLEDFGVGSKPDMNFYVLALRAVASGPSEADSDDVTHIYTCIAEMATVQNHKRLREVFDDTDCPTMWDKHCSSWTTRRRCMTDGPDFITSKSVLYRSYGDSSLLRGFFTAVLGIMPWTVQDVIGELEMRQARPHTSKMIAESRNIYEFMLEKVGSDTEWEMIRTAFSEKKLVLGENGNWHALRTCLWRSPFALDGFQDLSTMYPNLEALFVRRLGVKKASPSMLINEVKRMAEESEPRVEDIHARLVEIGMMLTKIPMDDSMSRALKNLQTVPFLPKKQSGSPSVLVGAKADFVISDHARYGEAFATEDILLDFQVHEAQIMHTMFRHLGLTHRYLSTAVKEVSVVGDGAIENEELSKQLQSKAYGLYCCAAKYKSCEALQGQHLLYAQLSALVVSTYSYISTNLVISILSESISVPSERSFIHHKVLDEKITIYVPNDQRERRSCYRSQLPKLLASILGVSGAATFDISGIVSASQRDLDDVLEEQDIPEVEWIPKPAFDILEELEEVERPGTPNIALVDVRETRAPPVPMGVITPDTSPSRQIYARLDASLPAIAPNVRVSDFPDLVEQVVRVARSVGHGYRNPLGPATQVGDDSQLLRYFDHLTTFGSRESDSAHNRKIGAVGEGYVYTLLSALNLPNFNEANWPSTIRSELAGHFGFEDLAAWHGHETSDLVYKDHNGAFTQYLRDNCVGGFPPYIFETRSMQASPIEYYLEVKSTTGRCGTRFYMSGRQYERMESMALGLLRPSNKVYVILRVYDMLTPNVGLDIFVDPIRFKGTKLEFETEQWYVSTK